MLNSTILSFHKIHKTLYILFGNAILNQSPVLTIADILIFPELLAFGHILNLEERILAIQQLTGASHCQLK